MTDDRRCCGSGTCIIDDQGRCWCGQRWDGQTMRQPPLVPPGGPARAPCAPAAPDPEASP